MIVDEALIRSGIVGKFKYQGVIGIDYGGKKTPDPFLTWNGQQVMHVFDEDDNHWGLSAAPAVERGHSRTSHSTKNRRRQEKESRKRNRPKK